MTSQRHWQSQHVHRAEQMRGVEDVEDVEDVELAYNGPDFE